MRAIDHNRTRDPFACHRDFSYRDVLRIVVGFSAAAPQHNVPVRIPHGFNDRRLAVGINADEVMRRAGRRHGINGHLQAAFRSILEADRHREAAGHLPVRLTFRCAG